MATYFCRDFGASILPQEGATSYWEMLKWRNLFEAIMFRFRVVRGFEPHYCKPELANIIAYHYGAIDLTSYTFDMQLV